MWRGAHMRQKRWFDFVEEENKVKRNISRLYHTVQHIPSTRSRLDTNSLWDLVGELESFSPVASTKSMQFTHSVENKTFSRKYLNLRLYPSRDKSNTSPTRNRTCKKPQGDDLKEQKDDTSINNKFKRCKKRFALKHNLDLNNGGPLATNRTHEKGPSGNNKSDLGKNCRRNDNVKKDFEKNTKSRQENNIVKTKQEHPVTKKSKTKFRSGSSYHPIKKDHPTNERFCPAGEKNSSNSLNKNTYDTIVKSNSKETNYCYHKKHSKLKTHSKCQVLGKIRNVDDCYYKNNTQEEVLQPKCQMESIDFDNSMSLSDAQSSVVKKLTNYWNNLLSNELEECNLDSDNPGIPFYSAKSLEQLAQEMHHKMGKKRLLKNIATMNSRHMSESNINILKRLENLNSYTTPKRCPNELYGSSYEIQTLSRASSLLDNGDKPEHKTLSLTRCNVELSEPENTSLDSFSVNQSIDNFHSLDNGKLEFINKSTDTRCLDTQCHVSTQNVIEVMLKLVRKLQMTPKSLLLSSEVSVPQSIKIMLILMTSKILSSQEEVFGEGFDLSRTQVNQDSDEESLFKEKSQNIKSQTSITGDKISTCGLDGNERHFTSSGNYELLSTNRDECTNIQHYVIAVPVMSLKTVEQALKLYTLCKEHLWMRFVFNPNPYGSNTFEGNNYGCPSGSFTFVYEGKILLEEDDEDEQYYDSEEDEDLPFCEFCKSTVFSIANYVGNLCDFALGHALFHWPVSPEEFVRVVYQVSVSILIWWVIIKEMFK